MSYSIAMLIILLYEQGGYDMAFQISASLLDSCVLSVLEKKDVYGYELTQSLKEIIEISESTLYPVLRRLQKEGYVTVYDAPFNGRNRRYYSITELGRTQLKQGRNGWNIYKNSIDLIIGADMTYEGEGV